MSLSSDIIPKCVAMPTDRDGLSKLSFAIKLLVIKYLVPHDVLRITHDI